MNLVTFYDVGFFLLKPIIETFCKSSLLFIVEEEVR